MDLLAQDPPLNLNDPDWRIFTRNPNQPAQYISPKAVLNNCIVNEGCVVNGKVEHSVLFYGVEVGEDSHVTDSVIMPGVKIGRGVRIQHAIVSENVMIEDGAVICGDAGDIVLIEHDTEVRAAQNN